VGSKEVDGELSDIVWQVSDVEWNRFRTTDLTRPPSVNTRENNE